MKTWKRTACFLLAAVLTALLAAPFAAAKADASARFTQSLYLYAYGKEATVKARVSTDEDSVWILKTGEGAELCRTAAESKRRTVTFTFPITRDMPYRTVMQLFREGGDTALCEALLFCDQSRNEGVRRVATEDKKVAFTFDAANAAANTLEILDILEEYDAKGTFFVIGQYAVANPAVTEEIVSRGHEIASHSYEHLNMNRATAERAYESVSRTDALLRTFNGDARVLYRPPSGISTFRDRAIARGLDSEVIIWSVDSGDGFSDKTEKSILNRIRTNLHNGGIVLMHVYGRYTRNVLRTLLPFYAEQGYSFVTVSDLLQDGETYIDAFGTQRALHHTDTRVAPIAAWLQNGW